MESCADLFTPNVIEAFHNASPPANILSDENSWIVDIISAAGTLKPGTILEDEVAIRVQKRFPTVRVFHAACPENVSLYYEEGFNPLDLDDARNRIKKRFLDGRCPELTEEDIESAIARVDIETRAGRVWFALDDRDLLEYCGHYLIYGSEYGVAVAASIKGSIDYRKHLKNAGTPTIFSCDLPWSFITRWTIQNLIRTMIAELFKSIRDPLHDPGIISFGLSFDHLIPGSTITGHQHPKKIEDPLNRRRIERY